MCKEEISNENSSKLDNHRELMKMIKHTTKFERSTLYP